MRRQQRPRARNQRVSSFRQRRQQHLLDVKVRSRKAVQYRNRKFLVLFSKIALVIALIAAIYVGARVAAKLFFIDNPDYKLSAIEVQTDGTLQRDQVLSVADLRESENIFRVNLARVQARLQELPQVDEVEITRKLPSEIDIRNKYEIPQAMSCSEWPHRAQYGPSGPYCQFHSENGVPRVPAHELETRVAAKLNKEQKKDGPYKDALAFWDGLIGKTLKSIRNDRDFKRKKIAAHLGLEERRLPEQLLLRQFAISQIARYFAKAAQCSFFISQCGDNHICPEPRTVFANAPAFIFKPSYFCGHLELIAWLVALDVFLRVENRKVLSDYLTCLIALDVFCTQIPALDVSSRIDHKDRIVLYAFDQ